MSYLIVNAVTHNIASPHRPTITSSNCWKVERPFGADIATDSTLLVVLQFTQSIALFLSTIGHLYLYRNQQQGAHVVVDKANSQLSIPRRLQRPPFSGKHMRLPSVVFSKRNFVRPLQLLTTLVYFSRLLNPWLMCKVCRYLRSNIELTQKGNQLGLSSSVNKKAMLSQGEPRDAAVNFDTYRILYNGIVLFPYPSTAFLLVCLSAECRQWQCWPSFKSIRRSSRQNSEQVSSSKTTLSFDTPSLRNPPSLKHRDTVSRRLCTM